MNIRTSGTVVSVKKQWWLKVNTKAVRFGPLDGAAFPHIIKVLYLADGTEYTVRKWVQAGCAVPAVGSTVTVEYSESKPSKAGIIT